ncbi:MAG: HD domain-containing protein, partial [Desulfobacterales bacterium]|nr:HD domain-containing protein [Desulfobacterales bacterium]
NAMAVNSANGELIDPAGGRKDLSARLVRMVSPESFDSDPIRLLRAFRMAAVLGFSIDPDTLEAISLRTEKITSAAGERIREEWLMLLNSPASAPVLESMARTGLLEKIFPEIKNLRGCTQNRHHRFDAFEHTMKVYEAIEQMLHQNKPALLKDRKNTDLLAGPGGPGLVKHAALLHDTGKPLTRSVDKNGGIHFYNHETAGAKITGEINRRLRFSNAENRYVAFLVKNHLRPLFLYLLRKRGKLKPETVSRFFLKTAPWTMDLLILAAADKAGKKSSTNNGFTKFTEKLADEFLNKHLPASQQPPLITGNDLIENFGLTPSPQFSRILGRIEKMRLAGTLQTRRQALDFTRRLLKKRGQIYFGNKK